MKAIRENNQNLAAITDPNDSVGIIDSYFPDASFFREFERFDRHTDLLRRRGEGDKIHFVSICSPNYLHDSHIRFALRSEANAVCEKPLVLNPWNAEALSSLEKETGKNINTILQLRLHPVISNLKKKIQSEQDKRHFIDLAYITPRGKWYQYSWKGDVFKSGGIATNIGIHFFDMLTWVFGEKINSTVHLNDNQKAAGFLELKNADVRWFLSIDRNDLMLNGNSEQMKTYRAVVIDENEIEFSEGFADLHTESYREILNGNGFRIKDTLPSIEIVHEIRTAVPIGTKGDYHPLLKKLFDK